MTRSEYLREVLKVPGLANTQVFEKALKDYFVEHSISPDEREDYYDEYFWVSKYKTQRLVERESSDGVDS